MSSVFPVYSLFTMQLGTVQQAPQEFRGRWNYLRFIDCRDAQGNFSPDGLVTVVVGNRQEDAIPVRINGLLTGETESYQFAWAAQPGLIATFLASRIEADGSGVQMEAPPAKQLVTTSSGLAVATQQLVVNTGAAQLILAASGSRQKGIIRNRGTGALYVGPAAVTKTTGFSVDPGEAITIDGTTAAIYGTASVDGTPIHTLAEG